MDNISLLLHLRHIMLVLYSTIFGARIGATSKEISNFITIVNLRSRPLRLIIPSPLFGVLSFSFHRRVVREVKATIPPPSPAVASVSYTAAWWPCIIIHT